MSIYRTIISIRIEVLKDILHNPEYLKKLVDTDTTEDIIKILVEYCKVNGYKVKEVFT